MNDQNFRMNNYYRLNRNDYLLCTTYQIVKLWKIDLQYISINCRCQYLRIISDNFSSV